MKGGKRRGCAWQARAATGPEAPGWDGSWGGSPKPAGDVAHSAALSLTSKHPPSLAPSPPAGRPAPGPALPSPLSLRRSSGSNCSDISALTGPGCQDTDLPVWVAVGGFSPGLSGGVRREEAGGGQAAQVGSAPDPSGGGWDAGLRSCSPRPLAQAAGHLEGPSPGGVRAMSACVAHSTRGPKTTTPGSDL